MSRPYNFPDDGVEVTREHVAFGGNVYRLSEIRSVSISPSVKWSPKSILLQVVLPVVVGLSLLSLYTWLPPFTVLGVSSRVVLFVGVMVFLFVGLKMDAVQKWVAYKLILSGAFGEAEVLESNDRAYVNATRDKIMLAMQAHGIQLEQSPGAERGR